MAEKLNIEGQEISIRQVNQEDYICLTDMIADRGKSGYTIRNWLRGRPTLEFLRLWEQMNNANFNNVGYDTFTEDMGLNTFSPSVGEWIRSTNAIGIISKAGRYGGTYAHSEIALVFGQWISPKFQFLLIKEFQRLKSEEYQRKKLEWDTSRFLSKINYSLQTSAIEESLIPRLEGKEKGLAYATEADLINLALFGKTAKQWRIDNPDFKGNIRDHASITQLIVLSNLETHNSYLIKAGASKEARFARLCEIADNQLEIFSRDKRLNDDKKFLE